MKFLHKLLKHKVIIKERYEKELDKILPEPGAWSYENSSGNRRQLTPSDMRTLDEAKGATIDSKPEDSLVTYEEEKKALKDASNLGFENVKYGTS